jgi:hypothetical protein
MENVRLREVPQNAIFFLMLKKLFFLQEEIYFRNLQDSEKGRRN